MESNISLPIRKERGMILRLLIFILMGCSVVLVWQAFMPVPSSCYRQVHEANPECASHALEEMFVWVAYKRLVLLFGLTPIILGFVAYIIFGKGVSILAGFILGFILPSTVSNGRDASAPFSGIRLGRSQNGNGH